MKPTLLYIHGLGSDRNSRKFLNIKDYFKNQFEYDFIEWDKDSNIDQLLKNKLYEGQTVDQYIIFGDSTGANFGYHFRALRGNSKDILVMSSPLLYIEKRIANYEFPNDLKRYLLQIKNIENALVIASRTDEILDQNYLFEKAFEKVTVLEVEDNHRLKKFMEILPKIQFFLDNKEVGKGWSVLIKKSLKTIFYFC